MNKYQSYKPSGVEWFGDIPSNWDVYRLGLLGTFSSSGIDKKSNEGEGEVKMVNYTDLVQSRKYFPVQNGDKEYMVVTTPNSKLLEHSLKKGDMVFIPSSETKEDLGYSSLIDFDKSDVVYSYHILRFRFQKEVYHYYKKYLVNHHSVLNQFSLESKGTTRQIIGRNVFNNVKVVLPPLVEQNQIVQFLDEKTELIDKLISTKERKINLLKEQRTSQISQVVTKGLNPNVKMKNSGVEWINEIPEHWVTLGFTKIIKIRHGYQFREYDFTDVGIRIIKITQLDKDGYLNLDSCSFIDDKRLDEFERILIKENDVLMCLTGGTIGKIIKVGKVNEPLVQNYRVGHFSPLNDKIINDYVFWFMTSSLTTSQMFSEIRETGQPNIGMEDFGKMKVILPPLSEQIEIVKHLVLKTKEIDDLVSMEQKKIDLLKEYRQSLISEVVTGKIKVTI
jgi:type I restriction enzyme S subunit